MNEIERLRLQLALEQVVDEQFDVRDLCRLQKRTSGTEQVLVDVGTYDFACRPDPFAEDPKPAQGSAADIQRAEARSIAELREELPPGRLPDARLQLQALQLRRLVGERVVALRHRHGLSRSLRGQRQAYARAVGEPLRTLETPDGRTLAYAVWGDRDGFSILGLHGTPGCRLERWPHEDLYVELGVCLVTHDRAGYGRSDRRRGRRVADEVDDVRSLADELGLDRFGVTGGSGGGP